MPEQTEAEAQSTILKGLLGDFFMLEKQLFSGVRVEHRIQVLEQLEVELKKLLGWIDLNATQEVISLLVNRDFQPILEYAANRAFNTPIDTLNGDGQTEPLPDLILAISEGYTVAVINDKGEVLGLVHKPVEKYKGFNVCGVALEKAVILKVLEDAGIHGGLRPEGNFRIAQRLGFKRHIGSADSPHPVENFGNVYIGASGCGQGLEMNRRLLEGGEPGTYTNAGRFDNFMAELTGWILTHPSDDPIMPAYQLEVFSTVYRNH